MEHKEKPSFTYQRTIILLFFFLLYCVPMGLVTVLDSLIWPADSMERAAAILGVGLGGYALLFLLLVFVLPALVQRRGRAERARQWKCTAFHASLGSSVLTIVWTLGRIPMGPVGIRIAVGAVVALAVFALLLRLKSHYFDKLCGWPTWTWRAPR